MQALVLLMLYYSLAPATYSDNVELSCGQLPVKCWTVEEGNGRIDGTCVHENNDGPHSVPVLGMRGTPTR